MNEPRKPDDRTLSAAELELAALVALSALSDEELKEIERARRGQHVFWDEVRSLRAAAEGSLSLPRARPARDLWPEIQARIRASAPASQATTSLQVWKHWNDSSGTESILPADEAVFEATSIEGITVRRLAVDTPGDRITMLVRMAPGTAYPAHRHGGPEECYVLEGDLEIGQEAEMHAGDFQRMDLGSVHPVQSTRDGCLLLITSSRRDELLV